MKLEEYVLIKLMEECAEVQHTCSKILRFGTDSYHPADENKTTNADLLNSELYDLINAVQRVTHIVPGGAHALWRCNHYPAGHIDRPEI